jgi:hypothetical protein
MPEWGPNEKIHSGGLCPNGFYLGPFINRAGVFARMVPE